MARDHRPLHEHGHLVCPHDRQGAGRHLRRSAGRDRTTRWYREYDRPLVGLPLALGGPGKWPVFESEALPVEPMLQPAAGAIEPRCATRARRVPFPPCFNQAWLWGASIAVARQM